MIHILWGKPDTCVTENQKRVLHIRKANFGGADITFHHNF